MTAPTGRDYAVRRRWLPWRQRIPVDVLLFVTVLAGLELLIRVVLTRELVRGWGPSRRRMAALARDIEVQHVDPTSAAFHVVVSRDSVAMGDDATDNTRVHVLDDRTAHPTLATLVTAIRDRGRWVTVSGAPTTWVLRESSERQRHGRPLAVFVLDVERSAIDVHPVGDLSFRVAKDGRFHLEYLLTQSVETTLAMIAADPSGTRSLRADRQA